MKLSRFSASRSCSYLSIHAFIQKEGYVKQVPLLFSLISRMRNCDYKRLLKEIRTILRNDIRIEAIVNDFERALWRAVKVVLPHVSHRDVCSTGRRLSGENAGGEPCDSLQLRQQGA